MARPSKNKEAENKKKCMEWYEKYVSAGYAAQQLGLHRHTVEKYFQEFAAKEIEETDESFIQRQRAAKNRVIIKMDELLEVAQEQQDRVKLSEADYSQEGIQMERLLQKNITDMNEMYQQKADIEMTPTLDIHLENMIESKFGHIEKEDEATQKPKPKRHKSSK